LIGRRLGAAVEATRQWFDGARPDRGLKRDVEASLVPASRTGGLLEGVATQDPVRPQCASELSYLGLHHRIIVASRDRAIPRGPWPCRLWSGLAHRPLRSA
jgi:hypothetical protein